MGDWFSVEKIDDETYNGFEQLWIKGILTHGSGIFDFGNFQIHI